MSCTHNTVLKLHLILYIYIYMINGLIMSEPIMDREKSLLRISTKHLIGYFWGKKRKQGAKWRHW